MAKTFKIGDHVSWNSEAGRVQRTISRGCIRAIVSYKGYIHHASAEDDPQYEIKSDKTDHIALHKGRHCGISPPRSPIPIGSEAPAPRQPPPSAAGK